MKLALTITMISLLITIGKNFPSIDGSSQVQQLDSKAQQGIYTFAIIHINVYGLLYSKN